VRVRIYDFPKSIKEIYGLLRTIIINYSQLFNASHVTRILKFSYSM